MSFRRTPPVLYCLVGVLSAALAGCSGSQATAPSPAAASAGASSPAPIGSVAGPSDVVAGAGASSQAGSAPSGTPTAAGTRPGTPAASSPASATAPQNPSAAAAPAEPAPAAPARTATPITLAFGGDIHFERMIRARLDRDPQTALSPVKKVLSAADLAMVNLETAVTTRGNAVPKGFNFRAPATVFEALRAAGIDVVSMANNHGLDYGQVGLRDSLAAARKADFPVVGIGADEDAAYAPYRVVVKGQRLAILGATQVIDGSLISSWTAGPGKPGLASAKREDRLVQAVREARRDSDTVVVYLHWGRESTACPIEPQRSLAAKLTAAGADVIVGSHAHWILGGGWHRGGSYVDYGLGNFVFYTEGIRPGTESGVLTLTVEGRKVTQAKWTPARLQGGVARPQTGSDGDRIAARKSRLRNCTDLEARP